MQKKNIVILATGGTIAGAGEQGENIGYKSGAISGEELVAVIPGISTVANVMVEQICNVNSDDMTSEIWINLARRIQELDVDSCVDGIVVTHGTDTMEETAFFLELTLNVLKPVVLTGAMRPATSAEPDGPANLLLAVQTAAGQALDKGLAGLTVKNVYQEMRSENVDVSFKKNLAVVFAGKVLGARKLQKIHANALDAFDEVASGACLEIKRSNTKNVHFDISALETLPKVPVLYFNVDADPAIIAFAETCSAGIVIAGAGAGEFSEKWIAALEKVNVPVVVSTRINHGTIVAKQLLSPGTIAAYGLPPAKAAVLLRLALTVSSNRDEIQRYFEQI